MHSTVQIGPLIAEINGLNVCSTMRTARQPVMQPRIQTFLLSSYVSCQLRMDKSQKWKIFQLIYMDEFGRTERERERETHTETIENGDLYLPSLSKRFISATTFTPQLKCCAASSADPNQLLR